MATRVMVVEDDTALAAGTVRNLRRAGYEVELASDGDRALELAARTTFALVVLDLMLPGRDGFEVLTRLRARTAVPVIVVTARLDLADRLRAFELGATDYVPKPFFGEELLARIQTRLGAPPRPGQVLHGHGARIDLDGRRVDVDGAPIALTPTELAILGYLAERRGRAISRPDLALALRELDDIDPRTVDAHVSRLRKKLGRAAPLIATVWGHGYRFDLGEGAAPAAAARPPDDAP